MSHISASTSAHIGQRWLGVTRFPTRLRGLGDDSDDVALGTSEMLQQGFTQQQIDALQAAGGDSGVMMGIATADNPSATYNQQMSLMTGVPVNSLSQAGIGASSVNWFNMSTLVSGIPNWMLVGAAAFVVLAGAVAEKRYR